MEQASAYEAIRKIPLAIHNLSQVEFENEDQAKRILENYAHNLVLTCLKDKELQKRLHEDPDKIIEELAKL